MWVARFVDVESDRRLFDLILDAVRSGVFDDEQELFMIAHKIGDAQPEWGVELLSAWLDERADAHAQAAGGQVMALKSSDYGLNGLMESPRKEHRRRSFGAVLDMQRVMAEAEKGMICREPTGISRVSSGATIFMTSTTR